MLRLLFGLLLLPTTCLTTWAQAPRLPDKRIQIVLIGTWHFDVTQTVDAGKTDVKDLLSARRQREIADVVARLAAFRPDKIFVEAVPARQAALDSTLRLLKAGQLPDTAQKNEVFQLALKTARLSGARVRAVDVRQPIRMGAYEAFYKRHASDLDTTQANAFTIDFRKRPPSLTRLAAGGSTVLDLLRAVNSPDYQLFYNYDYAHWLPAANLGDDYAGLDGTLSWYERNLKIFVNVMRNVDVVNDARYVLIYGSSHVPQLRHFFASHPLFTVIDANDILQ